MSEQPAEVDPETSEASLFSRLTLPERSWVLAVLRNETVGGLLLLIAAVVALVWANSPFGDSYAAISAFEIGPDALHLHLSLETWAADGLLAVFFFVAGLELKHELVLGTLADRRKAAVPIAAALGGMAVPALLFLLINTMSSTGEPVGWGIPMATDIAFALAVLAIAGRQLPIALRAFLLTLAVVDDLGAIIVIAVFYSTGFELLPFLAALVLLGLYAWLQRQRVSAWWVYLPLAVGIWILVHSSGIHATVAGVALGLLTRVRRDPGEEQSPCEVMQRRVSPISAAFCVPVFAFFAAGVDLRGTDFVDTLTSPISIGVILGLVVGKPVGVAGTAWLVARFTKASLAASLRWRDIVAVGLVAGVGFTVSLLIAELAFEPDSPESNSARLSVLVASLLAALLATGALLSRSRFYRSLAEIEERDDDQDGIPDVYQRPEQQSG